MTRQTGRAGPAEVRPGTGEPGTGRARAAARAAARILVNLALGLPAAVPLYCAWWLLTEYLPMDCRSISDATAPGFSGTCDYHTLDHAGPVMFLLVLSGLLVAALVLLVDVVRPRSQGRPVRPWILSGLLVPVPFLALLLAAHM